MCLLCYVSALVVAVLAPLLAVVIVAALAYAEPTQAFCFNFYVWVCVSKQLGEHYSSCVCVVCVCAVCVRLRVRLCVCMRVCVHNSSYCFYCSTRIPSYGCYNSVSR